MSRRAVATVGALAGMLAGCGGSGASPAPLKGATAISLSSTHACALLTNGVARCWGQNAFGQLGTGETSGPVATPASIVPVTGLAGIVAGSDYTCGVVGDGAVACWGSDLWGEIGDKGETTDGVADAATRELMVLSPTGVAGLGAVVDTLATADTRGGYTCAHQSDGTVQCWGANTLGFGGTTSERIAPTTLAGLTGVHTMALGGLMACFSLNDGSARCLGQGAIGSQLASTSTTPLQVTGLYGVVTVAAGDLHACALMKDGTVQCWGAWKGDADAHTLASHVDGIADATNIAAGGAQTCVLLGDGGVMCWNVNAAAPPARVKGLRPATAISVGNGTACAIVTDGEIQCWGLNDHGILGNGVLPAGAGSDLVETPVTVVAGAP